MAKVMEAVDGRGSVIRKELGDDIKADVDVLKEKFTVLEYGLGEVRGSMEAHLKELAADLEDTVSKSGAMEEDLKATVKFLAHEVEGGRGSAARAEGLRGALERTVAAQRRLGEILRDNMAVKVASIESDVAVLVEAAAKRKARGEG